MKRNLLVVVALLLATSMSAQLYVGGKFGYGFGSSKYVMGKKIAGTTTENIYGSMGQGLTMGLKFGYFFTDNWGLELGVNYFLSAEMVMADYKYTEQVNPKNEFEIVVNAKAKSSQMRILPQLVYKSDLGLYGRFGLVIPISGKTIVNQYSKKPHVIGTQILTIEKSSVTEFKDRFAMGFAGALGYNFEITDALSIFGEIEYIGLSIKSKSSTIIESSTNGNSNLTSMTTVQKETNYVDVLDSKSTISADKPSQSLSTSTGYSATRINFGVTFIIE